VKFAKLKSSRLTWHSLIVVREHATLARRYDGLETARNRGESRSVLGINKRNRSGGKQPRAFRSEPRLHISTCPPCCRHVDVSCRNYREGQQVARKLRGTPQKGIATREGNIRPLRSRFDSRGPAALSCFPSFVGSLSSLSIVSTETLEAIRRTMSAKGRRA